MSGRGGGDDGGVAEHDHDHGQDPDDTIRVDRVRPAGRGDDAAPEPASEEGLESTTWPPRHLVDTDTRPSMRGERAQLAEELSGVRAHQDAASRGAVDDDLSAGAVRADVGGASGGRLAYSPDHEALRTRYAARPAAPVTAQHAGLPAQMAQPAVDGEAVDRSVRGKARRRVAWVGTWITVAVVCTGALLAILIASFVH